MQAFARRHPIRLGGAVIAALLLVALAAQVFSYVPSIVARAAFPFADNIWSEQPLWWQLWNFAHGGPLYGDMHLSDSYDYGPLYLFALAGLRRLFGLPIAIAPLRTISLAFTATALVPLAAWTGLIAARGPADPQRRLRVAVAVLVGTGLGLATLSRSLTVSALHPDALLLPLATAACALAAYCRISRNPQRVAWCVLALCVAAVYAKQNAVALFPVLVLGWYVEGRVRGRFALGSFAVYLAVAGLALAIMPAAMRAWVSAPLWHPYQWNRLRDLLPVTLSFKPYLGGLFAAAAAAVALSFARDGRRAGWGDTIVIVAALSTGIPAFLKRGGGIHDLTPLAFFCVPYAAALFGELALPRTLPRLEIIWRVLAAATLAWAIAGLHVSGAPAPSALAYVRMNNARDAVYNLVCAGDTSVSTTIFPDLFVRCKHFRFASVFSWGEVLNTYIDRHPFHVALEDDPHTQIVAWLRYPLLPPPGSWISRYRLIESLPVVLGYGTGDYETDASLQIYRRRGTE